MGTIWQVLNRHLRCVLLHIWRARASLASSDEDCLFGTPKLTIGYNSSSSSEKLPRLEAMEIKRPQLKWSGSTSPNSSLSGFGLFD
ncbi:hypothetical protein Pelo_7203 [Pelomyxa schiedti]|nr:hypothetical protein Pelo_7203 [Pelomyxa schiedti]